MVERLVAALMGALDEAVVEVVGEGTARRAPLHEQRTATRMLVGGVGWELDFLLILSIQKFKMRVPPAPMREDACLLGAWL